VAKTIRDLTTGEVARMLQLSRSLICWYIDNGILPGYRIPGSGHRRVRLLDLSRFAERYKIPLRNKLEVT
jgi:excisionase family DNA binding protein